MPDREKVIGNLTSLRERLKWQKDIQGYGFYIDFIDEAIDLLKEQEAKQVIRKQCKKEHDDGSIDFFAEWYCPHCNMLILRGFDNPSIKFCYKCGKPVLWEGR